MTPAFLRRPRQKSTNSTGGCRTRLLHLRRGELGYGSLAYWEFAGHLLVDASGLIDEWSVGLETSRQLAGALIIPPCFAPECETVLGPEGPGCQLRIARS